MPSPLFARPGRSYVEATTHYQGSCERRVSQTAIHIGLSPHMPHNLIPAFHPVTLVLYIIRHQCAENALLHHNEWTEVFSNCLRYLQCHLSSACQCSSQQTRPQAKTYTVEFSTRKPAGLVFSQKGGNTGPVYVDEITPGGEAEKTGKIRVGDVLIRWEAQGWQPALVQFHYNPDNYRDQHLRAHLSFVLSASAENYM